MIWKKRILKPRELNSDIADIATEKAAADSVLQEGHEYPQGDMRLSSLSFQTWEWPFIVAFTREQG